MKRILRAVAPRPGIKEGMTESGNFTSRQTGKKASPKASSSDTRFALGEILAGKYEVVSFIGSGGMSQVFRVRQIYLNKLLALKVLDLSKAVNELQVRRFQVEAKAAFSLNHANLVRVYDFGELEGGGHYLAMDLIEGPSLSDYVKLKGPMTPKAAIPLFLQISAGLNYAHQNGIVHRDLKPSNIMLVPNPGDFGRFVPQIVDFGIAKVMGAEGGEGQALTRTGEIFGSPLYMSPEQCSGEFVDQRSDIYSLGCTFFEVLTGTPPHVGANALRTMMLHQETEAPLLREASLGGKFSVQLEEVMHRMLAKSPTDRYQNMTEVISDLRDVETGRLRTIPQVDPTDSSPPVDIDRYKTLTILVLAIVVATSGILFAFNRIMENKSLEVVQTKHIGLKTRTLVDEVDGVMKFQHKEGVHARDSYKKIQRIGFVELQSNGQPVKRITFPERSIGSITNEISFRVPANSRRLFRHNAVNTKDVSASEPLQLEIGGTNSDSIRDPSIIKKIDETLFSGLKITGCHIDLMIDEKGMKEAQDANVVQILNCCTQWTKLESLSLLSVSLNPETLKSLNNLSHIRILQLDAVDGDLAKLGRQQFMRKLEVLIVANTAASQLLDGCGASPALTIVGLNTITDFKESLVALRKFPHLQEVLLEDPEFDETLIYSISRLNKLQRLDISGSKLTLGQLKSILSKCPSLRTVVLSDTARACVTASNFKSGKVRCVESVSSVPKSEI